MCISSRLDPPGVWYWIWEFPSELFYFFMTLSFSLQSQQLSGEGQVQITSWASLHALYEDAWLLRNSLQWDNVFMYLCKTKRRLSFSFTTYFYSLFTDVFYERNQSLTGLKKTTGQERNEVLLRSEPQGYHWELVREGSHNVTLLHNIDLAF